MFLKSLVPYEKKALLTVNTFLKVMFLVSWLSYTFLYCFIVHIAASVVFKVVTNTERIKITEKKNN